MPKPNTFPILFDEVQTLSTSSLREWGYLKPNIWKSGQVTWRKNKQITAQVSISVDMEETRGILTFDYNYKGEPVNYQVELTSDVSNLGRGLLWYFICPNTGKRCRKLYLVGKYFLHREAFAGCMYGCQTLSKRDRTLMKLYDEAFAPDKFMEDRSRYFKPYYRGKPTRSFLKLMKLEKEAANAVQIRLKDFL